MDTKFSTAIHLLILVSEAESPLSSEQIARSVGTNASYIRKVATRLSRAGIVESHRGIPGFSLIEAPRAIALLDVYRAVEEAEGLIYGPLGDPSDPQYPMPKDVAGKDPVYVGRLRKDIANPNGLSFWVVGDQIKKGAALNAVQIAMYMINK